MTDPRHFLVAMLRLLTASVAAFAVLVAPAAASTPPVDIAEFPAAPPEGRYALESDAAIVVPVTRTHAARAVIATVRVTPSLGAQVGLDYAAEAVAVPFAEGQRTAEARVPLVDDDVTEGLESVRLTIEYPGANSTGNTGADVVITDDDAQWPKPEIVVNEGAGQVTFNFDGRGRIFPAFALPVAVTGGSATPGTDVGEPATVFPAGLSYGTFTLPIVKDMVPEDDEDVLVTFTRAPRDRSFGTVRTMRIVIRDDDGAFTKPTLTAPKRARLGSPVPVSVACPRKCAGTVSVRLPAATARRLGVRRVLATRKVKLAKSGKRALRLAVPALKLRRAVPLSATVHVRTVSGKGRAKTASARVRLVR